MGEPPPFPPLLSLSHSLARAWGSCSRRNLAIIPSQSFSQFLLLFNYPFKAYNFLSLSPSLTRSLFISLSSLQTHIRARVDDEKAWESKLPKITLTTFLGWRPNFMCSLCITQILHISVIVLFSWYSNEGFIIMLWMRFHRLACYSCN